MRRFAPDARCRGGGLRVGRLQVDTVPVDRFSAHVDPAPARLGAIINPNGGICAIKYAVSDIERQTIETPVGHQVPGRKMS
jgi:hypothetical protein